MVHYTDYHFDFFLCNSKLQTQSRCSEKKKKQKTTRYCHKFSLLTACQTGPNVWLPSAIWTQNTRFNIVRYAKFALDWCLSYFEFGVSLSLSVCLCLSLSLCLCLSVCLHSLFLPIMCKFEIYKVFGNNGAAFATQINFETWLLFLSFIVTVPYCGFLTLLKSVH